MPRRRRRGSPKTRRPAARPAVGAARRHDAAAPLVEPAFDAPGFDRAIRHQPLPRGPGAGGDAPAAAVQRSIDFLRARSIDLPPASRTRGLRALACCALSGAAAASGASGALQELGWHLGGRSAAACVFLALFAGMGAGCWAPRVALLWKLRRLGLVDTRLRTAAAPCSTADDEKTESEFFGGVVGALLLSCGAAWAIVAVLIANLEVWRGYVCDASMLPPSSLVALIVAPAIAAVLFAAAVSGACLPALTGWQRLLSSSMLRPGMLAGAALSGAACGALIPALTGVAPAVAAAPVLVFIAAGIAALPRRCGLAPTGSFQAIAPISAGVLLPASPLAIAGAIATAAALSASAAPEPAALAVAAGGAAAGAWCAALVGPPRGRRLLAAILLGVALLALLLPSAALSNAPARGPLLAGVACGLAAAAAVLSARSLLSRLRNLQLTVAMSVGGACLGGAAAALLVQLSMWRGPAAAAAGAPISPSYFESLLRSGGLSVARVGLGSPENALRREGVANVDLAGRRHDALLVHTTAAEFDAWARDRAGAARLLRRLEAALRPGGRIVLAASDEPALRELAARIAAVRNTLDSSWFLARVDDGRVVEFGLLAGRDIPAWAAARSGAAWRIELEPLAGP